LSDPRFSLSSFPSLFDPTAASRQTPTTAKSGRPVGRQDSLPFFPPPFFKKEATNFHYPPSFLFLHFSPPRTGPERTGAVSARMVPPPFFLFFPLPFSSQYKVGAVQTAEKIREGWRCSSAAYSFFFFLPPLPRPPQFQTDSPKNAEEGVVYPRFFLSLPPSPFLLFSPLPPTPTRCSAHRPDGLATNGQIDAACHRLFFSPFLLPPSA